MADDLDRLANEAGTLAPGDAGDAAADPSGAAPAELRTAAQDLDARNERALCMVLALFREACGSSWFDPPLTTPARHLADDKLPALAGPWARVFSHYGIDLWGSIDHPIVEALALTGPALWQFSRALGAELRDRARKPADDAAQGSGE